MCAVDKILTTKMGNISESIGLAPSLFIYKKCFVTSYLHVTSIIIQLRTKILLRESDGAFNSWCARVACLASLSCLVSEKKGQAEKV